MATTDEETRLRKNEYMKAYDKERRQTDTDYVESRRKASRECMRRKSASGYSPYQERKSAGFCALCGLVPPVDGETRCEGCRVSQNAAVMEHRRRTGKGTIYALACRQKMREDRKFWKQRLVDLKGGKCTDCKLTPHIAAFQFDHLDASTKNHSISTMLNASWSWEAILTEVDKCELVCANCHAVRTHNRRQEAVLAKAA